MPYFHDANEELRVLNGLERRTVTVTVLGSFFSCFDFTLYFFFSDAITKAFFPENSGGWLHSMGFMLLILVGYLSRPLGGMLMADWGDRFGRRKVLLYSLLIISIATLLIATLPTYGQIGITATVIILLLRLIQGFGFGAEVPASWVYLAEHMPRRQIGSVCGMLICGFVLSTLFANFLSSVMFSMLTPHEMDSFGWRIPFVLGSLGTLLSMGLRYRLRETPIWKLAKVQQKLLPHSPYKKLFAEHRYGLVMTFGLSLFTSSVFVVVLLLIPRIAVRYFDAPETLVSMANGIGILFAALGTLIFGYAADRFNSGRVFTVGCILLALSSWVFFTTLTHGSDWLLLSYAVMGVFSGVIGMVPSICVRLFPVEVRMSGAAFSYNFAYVITGTILPYLLNYFSNKLSVASLLFLVFICIVGVLMGVLLTNLHGLYRIENRPKQPV